MKKDKTIGIILGIAFFVLAAVLTNFFRSPLLHLDLVFVIAGLVVLLITSYLFFKSSKVFLFIVLGIIFTSICYSIAFVFWNAYPQIAIVLLPVFSLFAAIFFGVATFRMIKDLFKKGR